MASGRIRGLSVCTFADGSSEAEKILERKGAGQADVDAARADENVCGDLQQARTNGSRGGGGQLSSLERESSKPLHHQIGKGGEEKTQLISLHPMGAGARSEEVQLLLLYGFPLPRVGNRSSHNSVEAQTGRADSAVHRQGGDDEAGIVLVAKHLGLADEGAGP